MKCQLIVVVCDCLYVFVWELNVRSALCQAQYFTELRFLCCILVLIFRAVLFGVSLMLPSLVSSSWSVSNHSASASIVAESTGMCQCTQLCGFPFVSMITNVYILLCDYWLLVYILFYFILFLLLGIELTNLCLLGKCLSQWVKSLVLYIFNETFIEILYPF